MNARGKPRVYLKAWSNHSICIDSACDFPCDSPPQGLIIRPIFLHNITHRMSSIQDQVVTCPDCGGIIGITTPTAQGFPCTCVTRSFGAAPRDDEMVEDSRGETGVVDSPAAEAKPLKLCCQCGKDLAGKKRLKDSRGYWCVDCAKKDEADRKAAAEGDRCPECARVVPPGALVSFENKMICSRCAREHREIRKPGSKKFHAIDDTQFQKEDKRKMYVALAVAGVLFIFILINVWRTFF